MSRGASNFRGAEKRVGDCAAECESPCVVASRPFGVLMAPAFGAERRAPHGFLGSWPTGQHGVPGAIVDAQMGSLTHQRVARRPAGFGVSRNRRVVVWVNGPSSTPRRVG